MSYIRFDYPTYLWSALNDWGVVKQLNQRTVSMSLVLRVFITQSRNPCPPEARDPKASNLNPIINRG